MKFGPHTHGAHHQQLTVANQIFSPLTSPLHVHSRRWFLKAGMAGLGLPLLPGTANAAESSSQHADRKSVILFWLSGGPSQIDMWDPKPQAPQEIRSPFSPIGTKLTGVSFTEHLPLQASIADKLSIIRSVDCSASNHTPITMQAGNPLARRTNDGKDGAGFPSMGSVCAKFRGTNSKNMPAFIGLADSWKADVWEAGDMGQAYAPVKGNELAGKFRLTEGISSLRLQSPERTEKSFRHITNFARPRWTHGTHGSSLAASI